MIRYPAPLRAHDRIGVTAPSAGVEESYRARLDHAVALLRAEGHDVVLGSCLDGDGVVSAPAEDRARELTAMLVDPAIRAVVPPWGGELAIDVLEHVGWDAIGRSDPTWLVGFSDIDTLLLPLTLLTGVATLHGPGLMDTPYEVPEPLWSWRRVAAAASGSTVTQGPARRYRSSGYDDYAQMPTVSRYTLDSPGSWWLLDDRSGDLTIEGRLIGGCLETVANLVGTPYGPIGRFARAHAPGGTLVYLEAAEINAFEVARRLHGLRLAGWFEHANGVLIGRTQAPAAAGYTQADAVRDALGRLDVPVVMDVDCGHVPPHLALVNGAPTAVTRTDGEWSIRQVLA